MTLTLQQQIEEAKVAQRKVEELRHLEAQAAELPKLVKQKEDQEWIEAVRPVMEQHKQLAAQQVADVTVEMREWRRDFLATVAHLTELVNSLPEIQRRIHEAADTAQRVASTQAEINRRQTGQKGPMGDPTGFGDLWQELGGYSPELQPLPNTKERYQKLEPLIRLLLGRNLRLYTPNGLVDDYRDKAERLVTQ